MHVLRLHCIDKPGIVAAVAATLSNNQCNIEESSQFYDPFSGRFFMRVVFRALEAGCVEGFLKDFPENAKAFEMNWTVCDLTAKVRTIVLVSKADHCLHDLLYRTRTKALNIEITGVVSNHPDLAKLASHDAIPFHHMPMEQGKGAQEKQLASLIDNTGTELVILARYMQILSQELCKKYIGRIINIHHSFLPGFKGAKPYHQAYERGVKIIGATAHYATPDLDEGPIITQDVEPIDHTCLPDKMQQIGRDTEALVLSRAVRLFTERRIFLHGNRTVIL